MVIVYFLLRKMPEGVFPYFHLLKAIIENWCRNDLDVGSTYRKYTVYFLHITEMHLGLMNCSPSSPFWKQFCSCSKS